MSFTNLHSLFDLTNDDNLYHCINVIDINFKSSDSNQRLYISKKCVIRLWLIYEPARN